MKKNMLSLAMAGILSMMMLTGCNVKTDSQAAQDAGTVSGSESAGASAVSARLDVYSDDCKIAFIPNDISASVTAGWVEGMQTYLETFSNVTFDVYDGESSVDTEVSVMDELINQKYDAIILQATDGAGLAASVDKAEAAGIPVITVNLDADKTHTALVAAVDVEAGRIIAENIGEALGGEGKVVIISATPGATKGENMDRGFRALMEEKYPNIEILDEQSGEWLTENANTVMTDFLTKYPQIDAVMCHNDAMAEGAAEAVKAAGRDGVQIWGADGEEKMLEYISQGLCTGTIYTDFVQQGTACAQMAVYALESGVTAAALSKTPVVKMAPIAVTADNLSEIMGE